MMQKTYKREVAGGMLAALFALAAIAMFNPDARPVLDTLVYPVFTFADLAWGFDAYAKQVRK